MEISKDEQERNRKSAALKRQELKETKARVSLERLVGRTAIEVCPYILTLNGETEIRGFFEDFL